MKKFSVLVSIVILVLSLVSVAGADIITFQPPDSDLGDLDHTRYYTWGINWTVPTGQYIVGASLFFDNIRNDDWSTNDLWVHLLPSAPAGITIGTDNQGGGDYFSGQGVLLNHWQNLPPIAQDKTYVFDSTQVAALIGYSADGNFGLGFDPDCHFYNDGVSLKVETAPVPEPATMLLLGSGLIGLVGIRGNFRTRKS